MPGRLLRFDKLEITTNLNSKYTFLDKVIPEDLQAQVPKNWNSKAPSLSTKKIENLEWFN